jgi:hypothetical protein
MVLLPGCECCGCSIDSLYAYYQTLQCAARVTENTAASDAFTSIGGFNYWKGVYTSDPPTQYYNASNMFAQAQSTLPDIIGNPSAFCFEPGQRASGTHSLSFYSPTSQYDGELNAYRCVFRKSTASFTIFTTVFLSETSLRYRYFAADHPEVQIGDRCFVTVSSFLSLTDNVATVPNAISALGLTQTTGFGVARVDPSCDAVFRTEYRYWAYINGPYFLRFPLNSSSAGVPTQAGNPPQYVGFTGSVYWDYSLRPSGISVSASPQPYGSISLPATSLGSAGEFICSGTGQYNRGLWSSGSATNYLSGFSVVEQTPGVESCNPRSGLNISYSSDTYGYRTTSQSLTASVEVAFS